MATEPHFLDAPHQCPRCGREIAARRRQSVLVQAEGQPQRAEALYQCSSSQCLRTFLVVHRQATPAEIADDKERRIPGRWYSAIEGPAFVIEEILPRLVEALPVPDRVIQISASFGEIYQQAHRAEAEGLDHLAGVGYRKSLEFLIKDFCIHSKPEAENDIKSETLMQSIKQRVQDPKVVSVAERATWLGNDETHYERKHTDRDVEDLKTLLRLAVNWIDSTLLTEALERDIQRKK